MDWSIWENLHRADLAKYSRQIAATYKTAANEAANIGALVTDIDTNKLFTFADYPQTKIRISKLLKSLSSQMETVIVNGIDSQWTLANNKNNVLCDRVFGENRGRLSKAKERQYYSNNHKAREAFKRRVDNGLTLSDRVWRYTNQFKTDIEQGLDIGLRNGLSAADIARDLKQYLQEPDKLFKRVRDEHGVLRLSEAAKAYNPGQGVYRSSYKNALRLVATETNMAYRTADYERWQQIDFVIGVEVRKSNNHPVMDMCDSLAGKYPKEFKFTGWHPRCRCYTIPILQDISDFLKGEPIIGEIVETPKSFDDWVSDNNFRFTTHSKTPYFIRDNSKYATDVIDADKRLLLCYFDVSDKQIMQTYYWQAAKQHSLTPVEAHAMRQYTDNLYRDINEKLRTNVALGDRDRAIRNILNSGLSKLDKFDGTCFRGASVPKKQLALYKKALKNGTPVTEKGFTSASINYTGAIAFADNVLFEVKSKNSRILGDICKFPEEKEVLFKCATRFKVVQIEKTSDPFNVFKIIIEEL